MPRKEKRQATNIPGVWQQGKVFGFTAWYIDPRTGRKESQSRSPFPNKTAARDAKTTFLAEVQGGKPPAREKARTVAEFIDDEWLPGLKQRVAAQTLEESTYEWYVDKSRYLVLHLGDQRLLAVTHQRLTQFYLDLLSSGRRKPVRTNHRHDPRVYEMVARLRGEHELTAAAVAAAIAAEVPGEEDITRHAVARIWARMQEEKKAPKGISHTTVKHVATATSVAFKEALRAGHITENPAELAVVPRRTKAQPKYEPVLWTPEQAAAFFAWANEAELREFPVWWFSAVSADRRAGNCGVRWQDVDLDGAVAVVGANTLNVVRHRLKFKGYGKTTGGHPTPLDPATVTILRAWRARQNAERLHVGNPHKCTEPERCTVVGWHDHDLVFTRTNGMPLHPERVLRTFQRAIGRYNRQHSDQAALPIIHLHALRHAWATTSKDLGIDDDVRRRQMTHSTLAMTSHYTHVDLANQRQAVEAVAALYAARITG